MLNSNQACGSILKHFSVCFKWLLCFRKWLTLNSSHITYHRACACNLTYRHIYVYIYIYIHTYLKSQLNTNMTELARFAHSLTMNEGTCAISYSSTCPIYILWAEFVGCSHLDRENISYCHWIWALKCFKMEPYTLIVV